MWSKNDLYNFKFFVDPSFEKSQEEREVWKEKSPLNFTFGQESCRKSDLARAKSNKAYCSKFPKIGDVIFNNNFAWRFSSFNNNEPKNFVISKLSMQVWKSSWES